LSVLACRYVDEVIIGAPWDVSKDMVSFYFPAMILPDFCIESMMQLFLLVPSWYS
jgi:glycerol-3-phosphate cytidylyltransferase-like family protein